MPSCAVVVCKNRSVTQNFKTAGITYHFFPKNPEVKEKWIEATGRKDDWFPNARNVICSAHFAEECFQPIAKSRRLFPTAVPTLRLRLVFETPDNSTEKEQVNARKVLTKSSHDKKPLVERYRVQIEKCKKMMRSQRQQIKRLQSELSRYRQKATLMKNILSALKNENVIGEEHLWLMECDDLRLGPVSPLSDSKI